MRGVVPRVQQLLGELHKQCNDGRYLPTNSFEIFKDHNPISQRNKFITLKK